MATIHYRSAEVHGLNIFYRETRKVVFQLFVMPPDSFVQRLVNYSTSCRLIRQWISILTDGRHYDVPHIAPAVGLFIDARKTTSHVQERDTVHDMALVQGRRRR